MVIQRAVIHGYFLGLASRDPEHKALVDQLLGDPDLLRQALGKVYSAWHADKELGSVAPELPDVCGDGPDAVIGRWISDLVHWLIAHPEVVLVIIRIVLGLISDDSPRAE